MATSSNAERQTPGFLGHPMTVWGFLLRELAPRPGRARNALRIAALTVFVVIVSETFHIPLPAYSAYIVFFISKDEMVSTLMISVLATLAASISALAACGIYMFSAGEPGLRLPLMVVICFAGIYLSRVSPLGPVSFIVGFLTTICLTLIDVIPPNSTLPSEETLTQTVLWLWVTCMLPIGAVVVDNLLSGRHPAELFKGGLADHLAQAGAVLLGEGDDAPDVLMEIEAAELLKHLKLSTALNKSSPSRVARDQALVARTLELAAVVEEWKMLPHSSAQARSAAAECGRLVMAVARRLRGSDEALPPLVLPDQDVGDLDPAAALLLRRLVEIAGLLGDLASDHADDGADFAKSTMRRALFVPDAFTNPAHVRFALKTTLAIFTAYAAFTLLAWPEIRTAMITCFFVTLGSVGETIHKMILRLIGALIGGGLGLATVIFVMPHLESVAQLCLIVGTAAFVTAWIGASSEKLSYAGFQIALAFFLCILVGYGPTIDMTVARDRVIGILLGNAIVFVIFTAIWPTSVSDQARVAFASAVDKIAGIFRLQHMAHASAAPAEVDAAYFSVDTALSQSWRLLSFERFEWKARAGDGNGRRDIFPEDVWIIQSLLGPAIILRSQRQTEPGDERSAEGNDCLRLVGQWLTDFAEWVIERDETSVPPPTSTVRSACEQAAAELVGEPGLAYWYGELAKRIEALRTTATQRHLSSPRQGRCG